MIEYQDATGRELGIGPGLVVVPGEKTYEARQLRPFAAYLMGYFKSVHEVRDVGESLPDGVDEQGRSWWWKRKEMRSHEYDPASVVRVEDTVASFPHIARNYIDMMRRDPAHMKKPAAIRDAIERRNFQDLAPDPRDVRQMNHRIMATWSLERALWEVRTQPDHLKGGDRDAMAIWRAVEALEIEQAEQAD